MGHPAIRVHDLSKQYQLGASAPGYRSFRETLSDALARSVKQPGRQRDAAPESKTIWALKEINFDVRRGEVIGIIGRNGAGKSTLLKVLSRITEPTTGRAEIRGRVASLLEVGTGFHPELTGRENILLNGSILGMSRSEIKSKFDEIVEFASVEKFVETPVKRYSSGMGLRLAFSVAAHLEAEIVVVDEVLAVGDFEFQKKCLGKMKDVAMSGRTVLFVSHNMTAVRSLCSRALLLHNGRLVCDDSVDACLRTYTTAGRFYTRGSWQREVDEPDRPLAIRSVTAELEGTQPHHVLSVQVELRSCAPHRPAYISVEILDCAGTVIMQSIPTIEGFITHTHPQHAVRLAVELPPLIPGQYAVSVWVGSHNTETLDEVKGCADFEVRDSPTRNRVFPHGPEHGYVVPHTTLEYVNR